jgi:hypothetical protein
MRQAARRSPEAEHTVWWLLLCREVKRAARAAEREWMAAQCAERLTYCANRAEWAAKDAERTYWSAAATEAKILGDRVELRARAEERGNG